MKLIMSLLLLLTSILNAGDLPLIANGMQTKGPAKRLVFVEELRFGGSGDDDHYFWSGVNPVVAAAPNGHIFVADLGDDRILEYDEKGSFIRLVGSKGNGPGEFTELNYFTVLSDGRAIAVDIRENKRVLVHFDKSQQFVNETPPLLNETSAGRVRRIYFSPEGDYAGVEYTKQIEKTTHVRRGWFNRNTKEVYQLSEASLPSFDFTHWDDPVYHRDRFALVYGLECGVRGLIGLGPKGMMYTARSDVYKISFHQAGKPQFRILKEFKPQLRSEAEVNALIDDFQARYSARLPNLNFITRKFMQQAFDKADLKPIKDPLDGLLVLPDGHLLAVHPPDLNGNQKADLFNPKGEFIGISQAKGYGFFDTEKKPRMTFRNGFAYTIELINDEHRVVRYRLTIQ